MKVEINGPFGKKVGWVEDSVQTYISPRTSDHILMKFESFGISIKTIHEIVTNGAKYVIMAHHEEGVLKTAYVCKIKDFLLSKKEHLYSDKGIKDYQKHISIEDMKKAPKEMMEEVKYFLEGRGLDVDKFNKLMKEIW